MSLVTYTVSHHVATLTLNRPDVRNCCSPELLQELIAATRRVAADPNVRVVVLQGAGSHFCAGADLNWMRDSVHASYEQNRTEAALIAQALAGLYALEKPLLVRAQGAAIGLGVGLVACADIVVASTDLQLGLAEVKLGIVPAVVGPYVVQKVGVAQARRYFISGERVPAAQAAAIGLVHCVVDATALDAEIDRLCASILTGGPLAVVAAKRLVRQLTPPLPPTLIDELTTLIATMRVTPEAQDGMTAFLEKRPPTWCRT